MKILFISPHSHSFEQVKGGAEQRSFLLIKALSLVADVDFIAFHAAKGFDKLPINVLFEQKVDTPRATRSKLNKWLPVLKFGNLQTTFPKNTAKSLIIKDLVSKGNYDFIVTRYIQRAFEFGLLRYCERLVVDADDSLADFFGWQSQYSSSKSSKLRYGLLSRFSPRQTRKFVKKVHKISFASKEEADFYRSDYLPNIPFYEQNCPQINFAQTEARIFFIGGLGYEPNYMGISYFLKNVYQKLVEKLPAVRFYIGGSLAGNEHLKAEWESYPNVQVLGFVDDLQAEYEKSRVIVVPVYQGAGTNIKVVEALQMRRACVVSECATRGFSAFFEDGKDYFVAKTDNSFVEILEKLLTVENLNSQTAENGRKKVQQYFSFDVFAESVRRLLN
ncbi:MAG: glycosyltransferase family 4 protein [Prevotellaceae bacterium]|jgi:glycosyltransferase involved in cell wall biosynthesis|nr:glycosyltransferase family 4 protein [Prevotellaceae bacterium]